MNYDEIVVKLGEFGLYQKCLYFLLCIPGISAGFQSQQNIVETGYFDTQLTFLARYNTVQIRRKTADKVRLIQINELQLISIVISFVSMFGHTCDIPLRC
jgi:hypothetical protein